MSRLVHLVRHGQTIWHADNRYAGVSDVPLTAVGKGQATDLARWAERQGLAAVASSHLRRAEETAAAAARSSGVPHLVDPRLGEVDFGRAEGLTRAEMRERFPAELDAFLQAPASHPLPEGEPGSSAADRFLTALQDLGAQPEGPILVVAHTTVIRLALCRLLGLPLDGYRTRFPEIGNTTITTVRLPASGSPVERAALLRFNAATDHWSVRGPLGSSRIV